MLEHTVAHTCGRTLISEPTPEVCISKDRDITINNINDAIGEGARIGRPMYNDHTCFSVDDDTES